MKKFTKRSVITILLSSIIVITIAAVVALLIDSNARAPGTKASIVITQQSSGGMCANGPCGGSTPLYSDGSFGSGTIPQEDLTAIERAIKNNKWSTYPENPHPNCQSFVDGSDISYIFPNDSKQYTLCMMSIPADDPLLLALNKLKEY